MTTPSFLIVDIPCDMALQTAKKKLTQTGLRALQTFDLHTARHIQQDCPCPNHGTADCDCQMVVLMVYGETAEPATLILHGSDGQTRFSIADDSSQRADRKLVASIKEALDIKAAVSA
ncbi:MAG: hypothetical protein C4586_01750 [Anaerolineaceae bacterium]|nr:MAG: hypothetical protein C4586_01750 [Anaerolineaceae bacterium]